MESGRREGREIIVVVVVVGMSAWGGEGGTAQRGRRYGIPSRQQ